LKGGRRKVLDKNRKIGYNCENFTYLSRYFVVKVTSAGYILTVSEKSDTSEEVVMKILIVDDEEMIRGVLKEYVEFEGNEAFEASDGMEAVRMCKDNDYDVVLMDVMMPRLDGFSAVKEIRKFKDVPVIMLSARGEEYDKLFGFEIGADDYVTKPFSPKEVMARINAVTKRRAANTADASAQTYKFEGLEIDMAGRNVYVDGEKAELTPKEYELLFYLVRNKGVALTREKLLYDVWGFDFYGDDRTVDTHIKMLRGNLKDYRKFIVTLRGLGYKFEV
jgi:two component transcriptional regulator, winged helix family protein